MEQQFDKQKMSQLVKQAMGEKTPFEYCRLSKLNSEYIDRLMTMQVKKPPSIGIMQQIAASSQGLVTLKELKMAAGYEQDETEIHPETGERTQPPKKTTEVLRTEIDGCIQTLQEAAKDAEKRQQYLERFSYENQEDLMNGDFTVYDTLDRVAVGDVRTRLRDILGAFLFRGEDIDKKVKVLSGGERARLAMARLMLEPYNLLILDEPTNHMDMRSKDILKNAIMKYDGTVIVVSHDREFLDGMVSKVYEFRNGGVREYLGGIYYFLEKRKLESLQEVERKDAPAKEAAPKASSSGKLTYEQKKEQEKLLRKLRKAVETIEASLADLEKKIADYDRKFAEATQYNEADYKAYNELKAEYDHQMHEWEKASYELEITEGE